MALLIRKLKSGRLPDCTPLVPLMQWDGEPGVLLSPADELDGVIPLLGRLAVIGMNFAQFTDGRGYSTARLLRERHGFKGELRAVGEILRDNLFYLSRCGFDSFELNDGSSLDQAKESLAAFSESYQASVECPTPLFRRRAA